MKFLYLIIREDGWVSDFTISESEAYKIVEENNSIEDLEYKVCIFPLNDHLCEIITDLINSIEL